jgi:hypothetical protein
VDGFSHASSRIAEIHCPYTGNPLNGIIAYLTDLYQENFHVLGIVRVKASSMHERFENARHNVINFTNPSLARTKSEQNAWIRYHFKGMEIAMSHYTIRSRADCPWHNLKTWTHERMAKDQEWMTLDSQSGRKELNGQGKMTTFGASQPQVVRKIRLRQTGSNSTGEHYLVLSALELFGTTRTVVEQTC